MEVPHEYTDLDDQPEDPEELEMALDTLDDFLQHEFQGGNLEEEFRGYMLGQDYSYSGRTIAKMVAIGVGRRNVRRPR